MNRQSPSPIREPKADIPRIPLIQALRPSLRSTINIGISTAVSKTEPAASYAMETVPEPNQPENSAEPYTILLVMSVVVVGLRDALRSVV